MTKNQAISHLNDMLMWGIVQADEYNALKMAIKALEQEPFINKDCISTGVCEHDKNVVLGKMRAEIKAEILSHSGTGEEVIQAYTDGLNYSLRVIDKALKEQKE